MRVVFLLLLCAACQDNSGSIVFRPNYQPALQTQFACADDPRKPTQLHVHILADGVSYDETVNFPAMDVVQFDIPIGTMRTIDMELLDKYNCKLYSGSRGPVSFAEGDNGDLVVSMRPPSATGDYVDADHDGLSLCFERALMTKDSAADSDGDGFSDFCEASITCTNPAKASSKPSGTPASRCNPAPADGGVD